MDRWRLMYSACYGLEVVYVEYPGVEVAVPSDNVERMISKRVGVDRIVYLYFNIIVAVLSVCDELVWSSKVSVAEWCELGQLAVIVSVSLWDLDWSRGL